MNKVRDAQKAWVPGLNSIDWQMGQSAYLRGEREIDEDTCDDIWPWLQEKRSQNRLEKEKAIEGGRKGAGG
eukprot:5675861-Pyramimonas_sp.AAC.1